jgi:uncharacterized protein involved in copper resistance
MRSSHLAVAAMAAFLIGPSLAAPAPASAAKAHPPKSRPAAATHTVTLDLTGMD